MSDRGVTRGACSALEPHSGALSRRTVTPTPATAPASRSAVSGPASKALVRTLTVALLCACSPATLAANLGVDPCTVRQSPQVPDAPARSVEALFNRMRMGFWALCVATEVDAQ